MGKHAVILSGKEQKAIETQKQYDDALQRERANRQRVIELHSKELQTTIVNTERKTDRAWDKVCDKLQSQVGALQTQVAHYELQRGREERKWASKEQQLMAIGDKLRADLTVTLTLLH